MIIYLFGIKPQTHWTFSLVGGGWHRPRSLFPEATADRKEKNEKGGRGKEFWEFRSLGARLDTTTDMPPYAGCWEET